MIKTITKEDLEQSLVPPAKKGDFLMKEHGNGKHDYVLPYDLVWKRNPRWSPHQGYWSFDIPGYRYGVFNEGDRVEVRS